MNQFSLSSKLVDQAKQTKTLGFDFRKKILFDTSSLEQIKKNMTDQDFITLNSMIKTLPFEYLNNFVKKLIEERCIQKKNIKLIKF